VSYKTHLYRLLIPWSLTLIAYSNSFTAGLVYDSRVAIVEDARVHSTANIHATLTQDIWSASSSGGNYRPLTTFCYLLNYAILGNGPNPFGYHCVNFLLHAVNIALVYFLALLLFQNSAVLAVSTATLWSLHPILTESITNIVGRADMLAAMGVLGGLLCHIYGVSAIGRARVIWLAFLAAATAVGMFSKESAIAILPILAIYDIAWRPGKWRACLAGYVTALGVVVVYLYLRHAFLSPLMERAPEFGDNPLTGADFLSARLTAIKVLGKYLLLLVWPVSLSADYSYNQIRIATLAGSQMLISLLAYLGIAVVAFVSYRRHKPLFFFCAFYLATLAPTANILILIGTIMGERLLYLPSIAFAGCVVLAAYSLRRYAPVILGVICLLYGARTFARNFDWHDELSLWTSAAQVSPASYRVHNMLSYWYTLQRPQETGLIRRETERTLAILDPLPAVHSAFSPYINAAAWYRTHGDPRRALALLQRGDTIIQAQAEELVRINRANGKNAVVTGAPLVHAELARTWTALGDPRHAIDEWNRARAVQPDPIYTTELAAACRAAGDSQAAAVALMEGLILDPNHAEFAAALADLYRQTNPAGCALSSGGAINPACPEVRDQFCAAARNVVQLHVARGRHADASNVQAAAARDFGCR
jgi:hypothetical protein